MGRIKTKDRGEKMTNEQPIYCNECGELAAECELDNDGVCDMCNDLKRAGE